MAPEDETEVINRSWGQRHPQKDRDVNEILVCAPLNMDEIEILKPVVTTFYRFAAIDTGG